MFFNNEKVEQLLKEIHQLKEDNANLRQMTKERQEAYYAQLREKVELRRQLQIALHEGKKYQQINDELITKVIEFSKKKNAESMAMTIKDKELEQQAKYTAELRSYISSLHEKVRTLNEGLRHHKEKHTEYKLQVETLSRQKASFDAQREKAILDKRVTALYDALEEIQEIVEEVI
jgi:chromosome segregation ATPase